MDFIPTLNISTDGVPDYKDYIDQIQNHAPDEAERIKLINQLLLNEKQQPFMYQALLHTYGIENESYEKVWRTLMSKGYSSIDQVIAPVNLNLNKWDLDSVMINAASGGHKEIIEWMISLGSSNFNRVMCKAAEFGHKDIIEWMISLGANNFNMAMVEAARNGHKEIIEWMISLGANYFNFAMANAVKGGHKEIIQWMIDLGATDLKFSMVGAVRCGHKEIIEWMIDLGANAFSKAIQGAIEAGNAELAQWLVDRGKIDPNRILLEIITHCCIPTIKYMRHLGANNFNQAFDHLIDRTYVYIGWENRYMQTIMLLVEYGVNNLNAPMIEAAKYGYVDEIKALIDRGGNDFNGALIAAIRGLRSHYRQNQNKQIIQLMICLGASNYEEAIDAANENMLGIIYAAFYERNMIRNLHMRVLESISI